MTLSATGGWCAPSETIYATLPVLVEPEVWPVGLLPEDIEWIAAQLVAGELNVSETRYLDLPTVGVRRGGIRW